MLDFFALVLAQFYNEIDVFLIILARILSFFIALPLFSGTSIPNMVKVMLSVAISFLLFSTGQITDIAYDQNIVAYVFVLLREFFVGFTIGFVVYMIFSIVYFAGQLMDYQIGFSMVSIFDPMTQIQVPITGNLLYFLMVILLVQSGGLHLLITALIDSFQSIPIGSVVMKDNVFMYIVGLLGDFFSIGLKISLPIVGSLFIIDIALGILVKAVPQMNVFVVGMPLKLLIGIVILYAILPAFSTVYYNLFELSYKTLNNVIGGFSP